MSNPVVLIASLMLLSVVMLLASATFGLDQGHVLVGMARIDFARGLITYLFAVVTIGTAVVLVVYVLTANDDPTHEHRFQRGKEILALMLGVFGTIVGFYFGSEVSHPADKQPQIAALRVTRPAGAVSSKFTVSTVVSGGRPPYEFAFTIGTETEEKFARVPEDGWIVKDIDVPAAASSSPTGIAVQVVLEVQDADGHSVRQSATLIR